MNRRGFLKLLGLAAAGVSTGVAVVSALPKEQPKMAGAAMKKLIDAPVQMGISNRGTGEKRFQRGYIWAPFIPIDTMTFHADGTITHEWHGQHAHRNKGSFS